MWWECSCTSTLASCSYQCIVIYSSTRFFNTVWCRLLGLSTPWNINALVYQWLGYQRLGFSMTWISTPRFINTFEYQRLSLSMTRISTPRFVNDIDINASVCQWLWYQRLGISKSWNFNSLVNSCIEISTSWYINTLEYQHLCLSITWIINTLVINVLEYQHLGI